jgi:gamma-glutamylcyclotransferase (GGCT)/AIG2-like uncharacterized protein YtfP
MSLSHLKSVSRFISARSGSLLSPTLEYKCTEGAQSKPRLVFSQPSQLDGSW